MSRIEPEREGVALVGPLMPEPGALARRCVTSSRFRRATIQPYVRRHRDPDLLLVESMLAPPPLEDARRSLVYWQRREKALPFYQRRARREAKDMAERWDARVRAAGRAQFATTVAGRILAALGFSSLFVRRPRLTKRRLVLLTWTLVPLRVKVIAGGVVAAWLIVLIASVTVAAAVIVRLA